MTKLILDIFDGKSINKTPIWMMRQAGRYLPEYRDIRSKAGSFLNLCYNPKLAAEVTIQPIKRFGFDGAILFSDILVVPNALGQFVDFKEGHGPILKSIKSENDLLELNENDFLDKISPILETISLVRSKLDNNTALIGFCGAPWTVATYMVQGGSLHDQKETMIVAYNDENWFNQLIDIIVRNSILYLKSQIKAGAELLMIFDSWLGILPEVLFRKYGVEPLKTIVNSIKEEFPHIPIIGFPKGAGVLYKEYSENTGINAIGIDSSISLTWINDNLNSNMVVQGNLDPIALFAGEKAIEDSVNNIMENFSGRRHIFNLGHGILPETPIHNVEKVIELVRNGNWNITYG